MGDNHGTPNLFQSICRWPLLRHPHRDGTICWPSCHVCVCVCTSVAIVVFLLVDGNVVSLLYYIYVQVSAGPVLSAPTWRVFTNVHVCFEWNVFVEVAGPLGG